MKTTFTIALLLLGLALSAQHPTCDGTRYLLPVFPTLDSTKDIQFGANDNAWGFNVDLFMDIYEPGGDTASVRPAIVFSFGEGFLSGEREDVSAICRSFAQHGFVVANIDERIYPGLFFTDSTQTVDAAIKATQDMKAAVRFLREDAATSNFYRIDPNYIFAGGISSGAISACYTAYTDTLDAVSPVIQMLLDDNGGLEGQSNSLQRPSNVQGVINWSGGLKDDEMMDAGDPPIFSAHDTGDEVVPYGTGTVLVGLGVTIFFEGSATLKARADALGIWNDLYSVVSNDHAGYVSNPTHFLNVFQGSLAMMYEVLCPALGVEMEENDFHKLEFYPNPASNALHVVLDPAWVWEKIEVFNQMGQKVMDLPVEGVEAELSVSALEAGLYLVRAWTETQKTVEGRAWVRHN